MSNGVAVILNGYSVVDGGYCYGHLNGCKNLIAKNLHKVQITHSNILLLILVQCFKTWD